MADFSDFLNELKTELVNIARGAGEDIKNELVNDGKAFAEKSREDLERWMSQLAEGMLTQDELRFLVEGKKDLAKMEALKQKGLAQAKIDNLKNALINCVTGSALKVFR